MGRTTIPIKMTGIKIHVFHTGEVCVAPDLPFGGDECNIIKASGLFTKREDRLWLPVSAYLIEHPEHGRILVDTGWERAMSPNGEYDRKAQIESLGSPILYKVNQGQIPLGMTIDEQLAKMGIMPSDIDLILLSHLDCDHANGLSGVKDAKRIIVSEEELEYAKKHHTRYHSRWWDCVDLKTHGWNGTEGPAGKSYDVFGDGSIVQVNIPGHCPGLCATRISDGNGRFVLLFSDGGYAKKSWEEMITSGISDDKELQKKSLQWIHDQSLSPDCVESLANHDPDIEPHIIDL